MRLRDIYAVPRRFDLATILAVTLAFSLLFGSLKAVSASAMSFLVISGFAVLVGLAQAFLFHGKRPRLSSILVGTGGSTILVASFFAADIIELLQTPDPELVHRQTLAIMIGLCGLAVGLGAAAGYVAGAIIGSVFLVADVLRQVVRL